MDSRVKSMVADAFCRMTSALLRVRRDVSDRKGDIPNRVSVRVTPLPHQAMPGAMTARLPGLDG
jgi:hypothetical protein